MPFPTRIKICYFLHSQNGTSARNRLRSSVNRFPLPNVKATPNMSWRVNGDFAKYFTGATLGEKMVATSGMTIGKNDLFLRQITDGRILEPYKFCFTDEPITLKREIEPGRLGKISPRQARKNKATGSQRCHEEGDRVDSAGTPQGNSTPQ